MSIDVFLSYSRRDAHLAADLAKALSSAGISVWYDVELLPGENWAARIRSALQAARIVLVLVTESSRSSDFVLQEAMFAAGRRSAFPVLGPGLNFSDLPLPLKVYQAFRFDDHETVGAAFSSLTSEVMRALSAQHSSSSVAEQGGRDASALEKAVSLETSAALGEVDGKSVADLAPDSIFVVHGHDDSMLLDVVTELNRVGVKSIVLRDFETEHDFLYEKFRALAGEAKFALVLISGDDLAASLKDYGHPAGGPTSLQFRARQNVILELGFFFGALGPERVFVFQKDPPSTLSILPRFERPSDLDGRMFMSFDAAGRWKQRLRSRLEEHKFSLKP